MVVDDQSWFQGDDMTGGVNGQVGSWNKLNGSLQSMEEARVYIYIQYITKKILNNTKSF